MQQKVEKKSIAEEDDKYHTTKKLGPGDERDVVAGTRGLTADLSRLLRRDTSCREDYSRSQPELAQFRPAAY